MIKYKALTQKPQAATTPWRGFSLFSLKELDFPYGEFLNLLLKMNSFYFEKPTTQGVVVASG
ncbi:MAG TPA: hypothetical protein PLL53_05340 [Saprospiraceae bacterium]|nr:hypothetical protein [Saprospiraceae bacterium]